MSTQWIFHFWLCFVLFSVTVLFIHGECLWTCHGVLFYSFFCLPFCVYIWHQIHWGNAIVPETSRSPYYCAPLVCVLNFSGGLAAWRFYKQTNEQSALLILNMCSQLLRRINGVVASRTNKQTKKLKFWTKQWNLSVGNLNKYSKSSCACSVPAHPNLIDNMSKHGLRVS